MTEPSISSSETGFTTVNGTRLYYEAAGLGRTLVLIHGGLVDSRMWDDQFAVFAQQYHTVRYDLRGNGKSTMPSGDYTDYEDLFLLLQSLNIQRAFLLGSSGGAALAIDFTLQHPEVVEALVLVAPGINGYPWSAETLELASDFIAHWQAGDIPRAVESRLRMLTDGPHRPPHHVNPVVREQVGEMIAHVLVLPRADGAPQPLDPPAMTRLSEIWVPTLIVVGDQDVREILCVADLLEEHISRAKKRVIREAAHMVNMEQPDEFNHHVLTFLRQIDSREP